MLASFVDTFLRSKHGHHLLVAAVREYPDETLFVARWLMQSKSGFTSTALHVYGVRVVNAIIRHQRPDLWQTW